MIKRAIASLYANAYLLLSLASLFWAGNFVMGRGIIDIIPPMALGFWRWILAVLIILPFAWPHLKKDWPVIKTRLPFLITLGFFSGAAFNALTYLGLHYTTATNAVVLNSSNAILIVIANYLIRGIKLNPSQAIAIAISMTGVLYIISKGDIEFLSTLQFNIGDLLVFAAMIGWAIYTALIASKPNIHWLSFTTVIFIAAALILFPFMIIEHFTYKDANLNLNTIIAVVYSAIFPALLAYIFYNRGVELIGGNKAGIMIYLMPLFGTLLSILFLNEEPQIYHLIGFALIISGVIISTVSREKQSKS